MGRIGKTGLLGIVATIFIGCSEKSAVLPQFLTPIVSIPSDDGGSHPNTELTNSVGFTITFARIREEQLSEPVLKRFFATPVDTTVLANQAVAESQLWQLTQQNTNICLNLSAGNVYAARFDSQMLNELLRSMTNARAELSAPLSLTNAPGRDSIAATLDSTTVVLSMQTNSADPSLVASNLSFGNTVAFHFENRSPEIIRLNASVKTETFGGYKKDSSNSFQPQPIFGLSVLAIRADLKTNEALLLGSERCADVVMQKRGIPFLSRIPAIGHVFTTVRQETNVYRHVVILAPAVK